jgi:formate hydrogenlyase transcriptional activator
MGPIRIPELLLNNSNLAVLDHCPDPIVWANLEGEIVFANTKASELVGLGKDQLRGRRIFEFIAGSDYEDWKAKWLKVVDLEAYCEDNAINIAAGKTVPVEAIAKKMTLNGVTYVVFYWRSATGQKDPNEMLRIISQGTSSVVGGDFFRSLAYHLVNTVGIRYAIITECANTAKTKLRTIVYIERENFLDNFEYEVSGTPCELVMQGKPYFCESSLEILFPKERGIQSYFAVPIYLHDGEVVGHLAIFDTRPMKVTEQQLNILQIFANRAGAEMDRKLSDMVIQENMARYHSLFEDSPIGLCEEDFSEAKRHVDKLKSDYGMDLASIFKKYPDEIWTCWQKVKRLHANKSQVKLFDLQTQNEYFEYLQEAFMPAAFELLLLTYDSGQMTFEREIEIKTASGQKKILNIKRAILTGSEGDWAKSIISCVDITEQKRNQEYLKKALQEVKVLKERLEAENVYLQEEIKHDHNFEEIVCDSAALTKVLEKIQQVANTDAAVLILGESGTGKELIARAIHSTSGRAGRPLVKINCAALPSNLIESELFGHEKGAFTGALSLRPGRFELADKGTIFLDEIGELPIELQAKLLRVLQEGEFERLGSSKTIKVDVRIIAATNRDLESSVEEKEFRADLYYRLNVFPIFSPPLRDRKEDIPLLVNHFCKKYGGKIGRKIRVVPKATLDRLMAYHWPGNVRELENIIERGLIISAGDSLDLGDWSPSKIPELVAADKFGGPADQNPSLNLEAIEREHIRRVLDSKAWKIRGADGAARALGLNPTTLEARLKKLGLSRPR